VDGGEAARQKGGRSSRKSQRKAQKSAAKRAAADAVNQARNPRRGKKKKARPEPIVQAKPAPRTRPTPRAAVTETRETLSERDPARAPASVVSSRPAARSVKKRPVPQSTRVAVAVLLAVGLMLGFWLLFRTPAS
jgi:cobalamin biosynthesis Mg chelatase CobN